VIRFVRSVGGESSLAARSQDKVMVHGNGLSRRQNERLAGEGGHRMQLHVHVIVSVVEQANGLGYVHMVHAIADTRAPSALWTRPLARGDGLRGATGA